MDEYKKEIMNEYKNKIINILPNLLNSLTREKTIEKISSLMDGLLQKTYNIKELRIYADTLTKCREYSKDNNLGELDVVWNHLNHLGIERLRTFDEYDPTIEETVEDEQKLGLEENKKMIIQMNEILEKASEEINEIVKFDSNKFDALKGRLELISGVLNNNGSKYLTDKQVAYYIKEFNNILNQLDTKFRVLSEITTEKSL